MEVIYLSHIKEKSETFQRECFGELFWDGWVVILFLFIPPLGDLWRSVGSSTVWKTLVLVAFGSVLNINKSSEHCDLRRNHSDQ